MPNRQPKSRILLDWFTVSYRTVVVGGVGILAAAALLVWWLWFAPSGARAEALDAIHRAEDKVAEASTYPPEPRADEVRRNARVALEESRTAYANSQWEGARVAAIRKSYEEEGFFERTSPAEVEKIHAEEKALAAEVETAIAEWEQVETEIATLEAALAE